MSISFRLKEERLRLGLSQAAFAALAGATKSAQIKWEREQSSAPTAPALQAFAEAGADVLYILTGRRGAADPDTAVRSIEDDLAEIRRDILDPSHDFDGSMEVEDHEADNIKAVTRRLHAYLENDAALMTSAQAEEIASLLSIITDPVQLAAYRAADFAQQRKRRERVRESIAGWFDPSKESDSPPPLGRGMNILATLALDYGAPVKLLVELVHELREDGAMLAANRT